MLQVKTVTLTSTRWKWEKHCCAAVVPMSYPFPEMFTFDCFARDPVHARFKVRATKPAVAISVQIVLTHHSRCAQHMNQPVYTVAFVEQLTALLAIL